MQFSTHSKNFFQQIPPSGKPVYLLEKRPDNLDKLETKILKQLTNNYHLTLLMTYDYIAETKNTP